MRTSPKTIETICANVAKIAKTTSSKTAMCCTNDTFYYFCGTIGINIKNPELLPVAENWVTNNDPTCGTVDEKFIAGGFEFDYSNKTNLYASPDAKYAVTIYTDVRFDYRKSYIKACKGCSFYNSTKTWGKTQTPALICDCDDYSVAFLPCTVNVTNDEIFKDKAAHSVDEMKSWDIKDKAVTVDITIPSLCKYLSKNQYTGSGNIICNSDKFQICNGALIIETNTKIYSAIKAKLDAMDSFVCEHDLSFFSYAPLSDNQCAITEKWIVSKPIFNGDRAYFDRNIFKYFKNFNIEIGYSAKSTPTPYSAIAKLTGKDYTVYILPVRVSDDAKIASEPEEYISSAKSIK